MEVRVEQKKIDRIKEIQLEMLKEVDNFCRKNDIKYCLAYGSLLGAVRHNGYIPWDDDMDIWMPREDYERFLHDFKSKNNRICTIENEKNYPCYMVKIVNNNTILQEEQLKHIDFEYGVYIDIFVLDVLPKNKFIQELKLAKNYFLYAKLQLKILNTKNKVIQYFQRKIDSKKIYNKQKKLWANAVGVQYKDDATLYFLNKNKGNKKYKFDIEWFDNLIDKDFENISCKIPANYDAVLKQCYGDYMKLPPIEERAVHRFVNFEEKNENSNC